MLDTYSIKAFRRRLECGLDGIDSTASRSGWVQIPGEPCGIVTTITTALFVLDVWRVEGEESAVVAIGSAVSNRY